MNIDLGDYVITSDSQNFILNEKSIISKGKNAGKSQLVEVGYYGSWKGLSDRLLQTELLKSGATELSEIATLVQEFNDKITKLLSEVKT